LLDEPLSNLDAKLREQMRVELKLLQQKLGITVIYVTHDQLEALSLSDQVVVLSQGKIEQQGKPRDLYEQPQTPFVRDFLGKTVVLRGVARAIEGKRLRVELTHAGGAMVDCPSHGSDSLAAGQKVYVSLRPEDVVVTEGGYASGDNRLKGTVETVLFAGERTECQIKVGEESILVYVPRSYVIDPGQSVSFELPKETVNVWPA